MYARGQPRGRIKVKTLLMQLDVCGMGIASPDWEVGAAAGRGAWGRAGQRRVRGERRRGSGVGRVSKPLLGVARV